MDDNSTERFPNGFPVPEQFPDDAQSSVLQKVIDDLTASNCIFKLENERLSKLIQLKTLQLQTMSQFFEAEKQVALLEVKK